MTKLVTLDYMAAGVPIDFMTDEKDFGARYEAFYNLETEEKKEAAHQENRRTEYKILKE